VGGIDGTPAVPCRLDEFERHRDYVACQTTITGTFVREFTHSPVGSLPPNGSRVVFELINIFRYDDQGRLAEEWVQADNRSRLRQLGAEGR
jgi:predicted ester cyclase